MKKKLKKKKTAEPTVSYHHKPADMPDEVYQKALRKQFAQLKKDEFEIEKSGRHPVFADYTVTNLSNSNTYKVAIRSAETGINFCSCLDFKTNCLGTCKHIEAVMLQIRKKPNLERMLKSGYSPSYSSIYLKYGELRTVQLRIGSDNCNEFSALAKEYFDENMILKPDALFRIEEFINQAGGINSSFRCYPDAMNYIIAEREKIQRQQLIAGKYEKSHMNGAFNGLIKAELFPYQKEGSYFAALSGRCLIADEMGLGKTIQSITAAELLRKERGIQQVLIVCPTSLKYQWKSELRKFTDADVMVIEGNFVKREAQYLEPCVYKIASYNTVGRDIRHINSTGFDLIILDEAQRIKNWKSKIAQNVKKILTPYAFVLTGTPLENKIEELYSIIQFIDPFKLGPLYRFLKDHQITDEETGRVRGYRNLNEINLLLKDILIRRRKKEVLQQLPERTDKILYVPMTQEQTDRYTEYMDMVAKIVFKWRKIRHLSEQDRQRLLLGLSCMRMLCDSTYILDQKTRHDTKIEEVMNILSEVFENGSEKVVIFSQWERMTRLIAAGLDELKIDYAYLHGGIPSAERGELFERFSNNEDCRVFLSTDAGGVGLNLQSASMVINLDIPWNPAVLEQRIARVHRMGQKRNVSVINLVSSGTIEHRMLDVLSFKSSMAGGILDNGEDMIFMKESNFSKMMNEIEKIAAPQHPDLFNPEQSAAITENENEMAEEKEQLSPVSQSEDIPTPEEMNEDASTDTIEETRNVITVNTDSKDLVSMGSRFFSRLSETLASPEKTQELARSLIRKDPESGKTYINIPVENEKVVENALSLLSGFLSGLKR